MGYILMYASVGATTIAAIIFIVIMIVAIIYASVVWLRETPLRKIVGDTTLAVVSIAISIIVGWLLANPETGWLVR